MSEELSEEIISRARKVKLLLMDCDGVLTDGRLYYTENGEEIKVFNVRDGQGIVLWHRAGFRSGIISGRSSKILYKRATELGMHYVKDGSLDKAKDLEDILQLENVGLEEVGFVGDDVPDIALLQKVGFPAAVCDAEEELSPYIIYKTKTDGGHGAVREVINLILKAKSNL